MNITPAEIELVSKYLNIDDKSIIQHVIDYPWAYSAEMVRVAIAIQWYDMMPKRIVCWNSVLIPEE